MEAILERRNETEIIRAIQIELLDTELQSIREGFACC